MVPILPANAYPQVGWRMHVGWSSLCRIHWVEVFGLLNKWILPWFGGTRQVGLGLYHTKVTMTCVASLCDLRNCLKVPFPCDEPWARLETCWSGLIVL